MLKKLLQLFRPDSPFYAFFLGLLSFIAIIISLMTLNEMKKQRELSLMPIVYLQNFEDKLIVLDSICESSLADGPLKFSKFGKEVSTDNKFSDQFILNVINVGQGSAVDLEVKWEINFDYFQNFFDTLSLDEKIFKFKNEAESITYNYKGCDDKRNAILYNKDITFESSHLLSASDNPKGIHFPIPKILLQLHLASIKANWLKHGQNEQNLNTSIIPHRFTLSYKSVNGHAYQSKYLMKTSISFPNMRTQVEDDGTIKMSVPWTSYALEIELIKES